MGEGKDEREQEGLAKQRKERKRLVERDGPGKRLMRAGKGKEGKEEVGEQGRAREMVR